MHVIAKGDLELKRNQATALREKRKSIIAVYRERKTQKTFLTRCSLELRMRWKTLKLYL